MFTEITESDVKYHNLKKIQIRFYLIQVAHFTLIFTVKSLAKDGATKIKTVIIVPPSHKW